MDRTSPLRAFRTVRLPVHAPLLVSDAAPGSWRGDVPALVRRGVVCYAGISGRPPQEGGAAGGPTVPCFDEWKAEVVRTWREESWAFEWGEQEDEGGPEFAEFRVGNPDEASEAAKSLAERLLARRGVLLYPVSDAEGTVAAVQEVAGAVPGLVAEMGKAKADAKAARL